MQIRTLIVLLLTAAAACDEPDPDTDLELDEPIEPAPPTELDEPEALDDEVVCAFTGGCCTCQTLASGMQSCNQCDGTSHGAGWCDSGETYIPCAPGTCWDGDGKVNIYVTGGNSGCS